MTVQTTTSQRVRVRRWLLLCVPAAALAAIACWTVLTFAVDAGSKRTHTSAATSATGMDAVSPPGRRYVQGITALTFEGLAAMYGTWPVELADAERAAAAVTRPQGAIRVRGHHGAHSRAGRGRVWDHAAVTPTVRRCERAYWR